MTLDTSDVILFYELYFPLLHYVNQKHHLCPHFETDNEDDFDAMDAKTISDYLWENPHILDEYLAVANLPDEHAQIVAGWKNFKSGIFILERHLKQGSVFISAKDKEVYIVKALFDSWPDLVGHAPIMLETVLLPFRNNIISNGIVAPYPFYFAKNVRDEIKEVYMDAKKRDHIHFTI